MRLCSVALALLVAPAGARADDGSSTLAPVSAAKENVLRPVMAFGLGYGGAPEQRVALLRYYVATDLTGFLGRLSLGLTGSGVVRVGVRATGLMKAPVRGGALAAAVAMMPVARIGWSVHLEAGVGYGYAWLGGPGWDGGGSGVAAMAQAGVALTERVSSVVVLDYVWGTPGLRAVTAGLEWSL